MKNAETYLKEQLEKLKIEKRMWKTQKDCEHVIKEVETEIKSFKSAIKILNGTTVKRSVLMDFARWFKSEKYYVGGHTAQMMVSRFTKSFKTAKRN